MRRSLPLLPLLALLGAASLGALPWQDEPARLGVEVWRGFAAPAPAPAGPGRVAVLVDARAPMAAASAAGSPQLAAAGAGARRFLDALPADASVTLSVLGADPAACAPARALARAGAGASREPLHRALAGLEPAGGASLADALAGFAAAGDVSHAVVFSDLAADCGGDLCAAARALAAAGAQLDLVVLGDAPTPDCVAGAALAGSAAADPPAAPVPPRYRVYAEDAGEGAEPLAEGWIGGEPVVLEAERVRVELALQPPARIGPIGLVPGGRTRLSVLEFPGLRPRVREWRWETEGGSPAAVEP